MCVVRIYIYICVCEWLHLITSTTADLFLRKVFTVNFYVFCCCSFWGGGEHEDVNTDHSLQSCTNYCKGKSCWNQLTTRKNCQRMREKLTLWREREREKKVPSCMHCMYTRSLSSDGEKQPCHCSTEKQPRTEDEDCWRGRPIAVIGGADLSTDPVPTSRIVETAALYRVGTGSSEVDLLPCTDRVAWFNYSHNSSIK